MVSFYLHNRFLGSSRRHYQWTDTPGHYATVSLVLLCPTCGDAWGRILIPNTEWFARQAPCANHPPYPEFVGGSFIPSWRRTYDDLPREVLIREFLLHLTHSGVPTCIVPPASPLRPLSAN